MHQTAMHYPHYCYIIQRLCSFGAVHRVVHYSDLTGESLLNSVFEVEFIFMFVILYILLTIMEEHLISQNALIPLNLQNGAKQD